MAVYSRSLNGNQLQELAHCLVAGFNQIGGMRKIIRRNGQRTGGREMEHGGLGGKGRKEAGVLTMKHEGKNVQG